MVKRNNHDDVRRIARLVERNWLSDLKREGEKFRSFLLRELDRFLVDEWRKKQTRKRGGGQIFALKSLNGRRFLRGGVELLEWRGVLGWFGCVLFEWPRVWRGNGGLGELAKRVLGGPGWKFFGGTKRNKVEQLNWRGFLGWFD